MICTNALQSFQVKHLMIKWHNVQFVDFYVVVSLFFIEYYEYNNKNTRKWLGSNLHFLSILATSACMNVITKDANLIKIRLDSWFLLY
jgi:hypothetical protein